MTNQPIPFMEKDINNLSLKNFCQFMAAKSIVDNGDREDACISALTNIPVEDIQDFDLAVSKVLSKELSAMTDESYSNLINQKPQDTFEDFIVVMREGEIFLKRSEQKYLSKVLYTTKTDLDSIAQKMYDNMHLVAAVIFRKSGNTECKFDPNSIQETAEHFKNNMQISYFFPYLNLIYKKLKSEDELESSNS